ncbi:MAG: glycosyltransferase family 4 protein [Anaerolineales bacterium]|nr:glycosyltransferase family 4 protein [Anaerolineales bacterium]
MPRCLILWDIPRQYPNSMDRYADRLGISLRGDIAPPGWSFVDLIPKVRNGSKNARGHNGKGKDIFDRFLGYPVQALFSQADIYHVIDHGYAHLAYPLYRRKLVITCNDLMTLRMAEGSIPGANVSRLSLAKFQGIVSGLWLADRIIAISKSTKDDLIHFLGMPEEKISVIYMGVDEQFGPIHSAEKIAAFRNALGIPPGSKVVMHVSGVTPYKNIEGVLRTVAAINHDFGIPTCLLRAGGALTEDHWRTASALGIKQFIHEAGHLTDAELILAYNLSDVLLFPSWWEGFGLPPLEAMSCGTPVVVSNRASLPEVVGDAGIMVPADNHVEMALAIRRIFEQEELRKALIHKGFARAAQFTWRNTAAETLKLYENVWANAANKETRK